jgi:threonine dehydrogenase-like Zn-dependent dehydrogenase
MSSRNATRQDFEHVLSVLRAGQVQPTTYITHRTAFGQVSQEFAQWLDPDNGVIKAMITLP